MMTRISEMYARSIIDEFKFLKTLDSFQKLTDVLIPIKGFEGYLMPVSRVHLNDSQSIELFSKWRKANSFAYPTQFKVTNEGTLKWLDNLINNVEDRILFFVIDKEGTRIGHMGFANCLINESMEIDNVVRGRSSIKGLMTMALKTLINWAIINFHPKEIFLRVFEDNPAVKFYEKNCFHFDKRIPLTKKVHNGNVSYLEASESDSSNKAFIRMTYQDVDSLTPENLILTAGPLISSRELVYTADAVRNGWNQGWSYYLDRFATQFAKYVGVRYAIPTSSCTGALHLALLALGVGNGDEVIVPEITWVATANAVSYTGAVPVFADVDRESWCINAESVKEKITPKTKAIIPVHLYGNPAEMSELVKIAKEFKVKIVEDAAPAVGATYEGRKCGSFGDFGCFSFQGAKLMVTGEGGMLVTDNEELYVRAHKIWDQGRVPGTFWINEKGWKYKMSNIQAALGLGQLENIDKLIRSKKLINQWYREELSNVEGITVWDQISNGEGIFWMSSISLNDGIDRDTFIEALKSNLVDSRPVFPPISQYPIWHCKSDPGVNARFIGNQSVNLPSGVCLMKKDIMYICKTIKTILKQFTHE